MTSIGLQFLMLSWENKLESMNGTFVISGQKWVHMAQN